MRECSKLSAPIGTDLSVGKVIMQQRPSHHGYQPQAEGASFDVSPTAAQYTPRASELYNNCNGKQPGVRVLETNVSKVRKSEVSGFTGFEYELVDA